jgi:hypothetical protein
MLWMVIIFSQHRHFKSKLPVSFNIRMMIVEMG